MNHRSPTGNNPKCFEAHRAQKNDKEFQCDTCQTGFSTLKSGRDHIRNRKGKCQSVKKRVEERKTCDICGETFSNNKSLSQHAAISQM